MKTLYLVRHAKAVERKADQEDFGRTLIKRGEKDAKQVAGHLADLRAKPDLILTSPASRALDTARIFAASLEYSSKRIRRRKALYDGPASTLYDILRTSGDDCDQVVLVGHDPALTDLASFLAPEFHRDIPTSGVVGLQFDIERWGDLASGTGNITLFHFPGADKSAVEGKALAKELERKLYEFATSLMREVDVVVTVKLDKPIRKSARQMARLFAAKVKARADKKVAAESGKK